MQLNDVRSINGRNNITDAEEDIRSRRASGWQLYVGYYFANKRAQRLSDIEARHTSTIVSMSSSSSSASAIDLCSLNNESVSIPGEVVTLDTHLILIAAQSWRNKLHLVIQAWNKRAIFE